MAIAKLSTIVTAIAGTVGGVTFRRHAGQTVISKKSQGPSRATSLFNPRLSQMRTLITNWNSLTQTVRDAWATAALSFTFPDKFGDSHNLSGRELYLKLQGNLIVTGGGALDATTLASAINNGVNPVLRVAMSLSEQLFNSPNFGTPADWVANLGWSITANLANWDSAIAATNQTLSQNVSMTLGQQYKLRFTISAATNFKILLRFAGDILQDINVSYSSYAIGTYDIDFTSSGANTIFYIFGLNNGGTGSISNISLFKILGFQSTLNFDTVILGTTVLIQSQKLKNNAIAATFTRRQIIANKDMNAASLFDFSSELLAKFPNIAENDLIRIYITYMNSSGFRSVPVVVETNVLE